MNSTRYNPKLCLQIAELSIEMKDLQEAGRWLFITSGQLSPEHAFHVETFLDSCRHNPEIVLSKLPPSFKRMDLKATPARVQTRLNNLGISKLGKKSRKIIPNKNQPSPNVSSGILKLIAGIGFFIFAIVSFVVGAIIIITTSAIWMIGHFQS